jgi:hypothetical protein
MTTPPPLKYFLCIGGKGGGGGSEAGGGGDIVEAVGGEASRTVIRLGLGAGKRDPISSVLQRDPGQWTAARAADRSDRSGHFGWSLSYSAAHSDSTIPSVLQREGRDLWFYLWLGWVYLTKKMRSLWPCPSSPPSNSALDTEKNGLLNRPGWVVPILPENCTRPSVEGLPSISL